MLRRFINKHGKVLASLALFVGIASTSLACRFILHQPEVPEKMKAMVEK